MEYSTEERGQGLVEYAFLIALVAIVVLLVLSLFGYSVEELYSDTIGRLVEVFS